MTYTEKKILFITVRSDMGGGPKHLLDLISNFDQKIKCFIASPSTPPFGDKFKANSVKHLEIPHRRFSFKSFFHLLKLCQSENIDIIHSHGRGAGLYSRLLYMFGYKVVHTFHGIHDDKSIIGFLKIIIDKLLKNSCNKLICVSRDEKIVALEKGVAIEKKTTVIHNGVNLELIQSSEPLSLRDQLSIPAGHIIFGTLARLNYQKGIDLLIDILSKNKFDPSWVFIVAGDGEEKSLLKQKVSDNNLDKTIIFYGSTNTPYSFLKAIDIYFSTSRWEGLPISVLEAMAASKACVLSNVTGHRDIPSTGKEVIMHDFNNFIESLEGAVRNRKALEASASDRIKGSFSIELMVKKTLLIYQEI